MTDRAPRSWIGLLLLALGAAQTVALAGSPQMETITRPARSLRTGVSNTLHRSHSPVVVRSVTVRKGKESDRVEVQIKGSGPLALVATGLTNPARIVIDFPNVSYNRPRRIRVNAGDVQEIRVGMFQASPPVTRVELELARPHAYDVSSSGSTATVKVGAAVYQPDIESGPLEEPEPPTGQATSIASELPAQGVALPEPETVPALQSQTVQVPQPPEMEETTAHQAAKGNRPGVVRNITVSHNKGAVEVHIEADQPLQHSVTTLSNPERIMIDLANVGLNRPRSIAVKAGDVRSVGVSLYLLNPLVTRVVVNLSRSHDYRLFDSGNTLTLRVEEGQVARRASPAASGWAQHH